MTIAPDSQPGKILGVAAMGLGNLFAWAQSVDFGAVASGITGLGLAMAGASWAWANSRTRAYSAAEAAKLKVQIDAAQAKLKIDRDAAAAALRIQRDAEAARLEMEIERDRKLGPLTLTKLNDALTKLAAADGDRNRLLAELQAIRGGVRQLQKDTHIKPRVLIVDDDEAAGTLLCRAFTMKDYNCESAATVADAVARLSSRFAWVVLDVGLPDGSGLDLLRTIKARSLPCKVAVVTGTAAGDALAEADAAMADLTYAKPVDPARLIADMQALAGKTPRPHQSDVDMAAMGGSRSDSGIIPVAKG